MSLTRLSARPGSISVQKRLAHRLFLRVLAPLRPLSSTSTQPFQPGLPMDWSTHSCDIDAEPLQNRLCLVCASFISRRLRMQV
ncbi:uncharacterized protein M421DRAFT_417590 [Didymella exigua CBS 183.55]|uniref:Uncharacterized protein n=1 Tax=Didymella exigua CBS 183.55 TaxID=1150837 RepID=A0A6A5S2V7_9PLEO|nr:uncharacterized protein M421DRAFT_417590 [Didymella exigua CBS 183.55]KAF1931847.1 hypothetical protein M421DRAFT_417590 [Didymella exigua CBS 183.55]